MVAFLENVFMKYGVPEVIISDNGKQFVSKTYQQFLRKYNVTSKLTPYYHPQANPAERVIRTLKNCIRSFTSQNQNCWDEKLEQYLAGIRSAVHESTGFSPYQVLFGQEMILDGNYPPRNVKEGDAPKEISTEKSDRIVTEARRNIQCAQRHWKAQYDKRTKQVKFNVGDSVFRENFKLSNKVEGYAAKMGPKFLRCTIIENLGSGMYRVRDSNGKTGCYHAKNLKPATNVVTRSTRTEEVQQITIENGEKLRIPHLTLEKLKYD
jgi:hypothetical protein